MLDALNGAGFEVISDCQRGECGVCAIGVVTIDTLYRPEAMHREANIVSMSR